MASYWVKMIVDGKRIDRVQKKVREAFPDATPTVEKIENNKSRADRLDEANGLVQDALSIIEELQNEMQEWYDNMPENLQNSSKADEVQEAADNLQQLHDDLENVDFGSVEFPGMF